MRYLFTFLFATIFLFSCSFDEQYSFKSDWSGSYSAVLDLSGLAEIGGEEQEDKELVPEAEILKLESQLNSIKGISNSKIISDDENAKVVFSFSFEALESINRLNDSDVLNSDGDSPSEALGRWHMTNKGKKKFYMHLIGSEKLQESNENGNSEGGDEMGEMLSVTTTLTFPRKVKSIEGDVAVMGENDNQIVVKYSGKDLMKTGKDWNVAVRLK